MFRTRVPRAGDPAGGVLSAEGGALRRICVPVDAFGRSGAAVALAGQLSVSAGSLIRLVHVRIWDPPARSARRLFAESEWEAVEVLDRGLTGLWAAGARASGVVVDAPRSLAAAAIADQAAWWGADVMLVARRRRTTAGALLFGGLADQVARRASCPVLVMHPGAGVTPRAASPP